MSYANQFRKEVGKDWNGRARYEQGCFWSDLPYDKGDTAYVSGLNFTTPILVEVLQSTHTRKTASDFNFYFNLGNYS